MAASPYLGSYGMFMESDTFKLTFTIPDNCEYVKTSVSLGTYTITVQLKEDEKEPSTTFVAEQEMLDCDLNGFLDAGFLLPEEEGTVGLAKRPKVSVNALVP